MKLYRIYAIILRYLYLFRHSLDRLSDAFYWPTIDLFVWGITSVYFRSFIPQASPIVLVLISGILFWIILWRAQYEISVNLLEDLWNKNLINIFVSPLRFSEWILSFILLGIIKASASFPFAMLVAYLLYKVKIFFFGFYFLPFIFLLLMTGWWVGFFTAGFILRFGTKVQTLAWTLAGLIAPFSAIYYPISILPGWAQKIAAFMPTSYVFEGMREIIYSGNLDTNKLAISFILNSIYLIASIIFLRKSFDKVLEKGLVKLY